MNIPNWRATYNHWRSERDFTGLRPDEIAKMAFADAFVIGHAMAQMKPAVTVEKMRKALEEAKRAQSPVSPLVGTPAKPRNPRKAQSAQRQATEPQEASGGDPAGNGT